MVTRKAKNADGVEEVAIAFVGLKHGDLILAVWLTSSYWEREIGRGALMINSISPRGEVDPSRSGV